MRITKIMRVFLIDASFQLNTPLAVLVGTVLVKQAGGGGGRKNVHYEVVVLKSWVLAGFFLQMQHQRSCSCCSSHDLVWLFKVCHYSESKAYRLEKYICSLHDAKNRCELKVMLHQPLFLDESISNRNPNQMQPQPIYRYSFIGWALLKLYYMDPNVAPQSVVHIHKFRNVIDGLIYF